MKKTEGSVLAARAAANVGSRYANARSLLLSMCLRRNHPRERDCP
jgi:hypothetical protein